MVLSNWHNVLRAINMASGMRSSSPPPFSLDAGPEAKTTVAKLPKPSTGSEDGDGVPLPQTLVRIPTEHAPSLQAHAEGATEEESG